MPSSACANLRLARSRAVPAGIFSKRPRVDVVDRPLMRYWMSQDFLPLERTRTPKPGKSSSKTRTSNLSGSGLILVTFACVSFIEVSPCQKDHVTKHQRVLAALEALGTGSRENASVEQRRG